MAVRRTATVVFTDLVGSTPLVSQLPPDLVDELRRQHFELLRAGVKAHGGREVKHLGDGLMLAFDSATDAVACAVNLHQRLHNHNRTAAHPLQMRVGIATGDVVADDDDFFGRSVVEAARLCARARAGQILATDLVRLVMGEHDLRVESLGHVELKGLPGTVRACLVGWAPAGGEAIGAAPLPGPLVVDRELPIEGRDTELEALEQQWAAAERGRSQVAFVVGEPGIGKTRLVSELARRAHDEGTTVLFGRCHAEGDQAYEPFAEALQHLVTTAPEEMLVRHVERHGGELVRLVPELKERLDAVPAPRAGDAGAERQWLFDSVAALLDDASSRTPLVLVLDDLHWASSSTLLLLRHLLDTASARRLLLVGTARQADPEPSPELADLLAELAVRDGFRRLELQGLDEDAVVALVEARAGHELDRTEAELARRVARDTAGSPLFVTEILRNLVESGAVATEGGRWRFQGGELQLPDSIRQVLGRRIERLDPATRSVLEHAAILGRQFDLPVLGALTGRPQIELLDALDVAERGALVTLEAGTGARFSFVHALVHQTLYEGLSATRRSALHLAAVDALQGLDPDGRRIVETARHCLAAVTLMEPRAAVDLLGRAAGRATSDLDYEQGVAFARAALDLIGPSGEDARRYELLMVLATGEQGVSGMAYRTTVLEALAVARRLDDGCRFATAAVGLAKSGTFSSVGDVDEEVVAIYEEALERLGDADPALRARLLGQLAVEVVFSAAWERRVELCEAALDEARRSGDPRALASVIQCRLQALYDQTTVEDRLVLTNELIELGEHLEAPDLRFEGHLVRSGTLLEAGEVEGSLEEATACEALAEQLGRPVQRWHASLLTAWRSMVAGPAVAEAAVVEVFNLNPEDPSAMTALEAHLFQVRWDQGRLGEIIDLLVERVQAMPLAPAWRGGLAVASAEEGRLDEAREHFEWFAERDFAFPRDYVWWTGASNCTEVCVALGDQGRAARLVEIIAPWAGNVAVMGIGMTTFGAADRLLASLEAILGRYDEAEEHFLRAIDLDRRLGARTCLVRTARARAGMLLDRAGPGDAAKAQSAAEAGLAEATELGMAREAERLTALLQRSG